MVIATSPKKLIPLALLALLASCNSMTEGTHRGGVLMQPGPLEIQDHYAFRFVDKWRISHAWFSGPVDVDYCRYSRQDNGRGEDRFFEVDSFLKIESVSGDPKDRGRKFVSNRDEKIYGLDPRTGEFRGYTPFCTHAFADIGTAVYVALIKPDHAKRTDGWIDGATPVMINGLQWLHKSAPIEDHSQDKREDNKSELVERWVLRIPDTPYWLVMGLGGSTGGNGTAPGSNRNLEKFIRVQDLFHKMVESVRLDAIVEGSSTLREAYRAAADKPNTVHNCYESSAVECKNSWGDSTNGTSQQKPVSSR